MRGACDGPQPLAAHAAGASRKPKLCDRNDPDVALTDLEQKEVQLRSVSSDVWLLAFLAASIGLFGCSAAPGTGPGANPINATRASRQLTDAQAANYTVAKILGSWMPGYSH